MTATERERNERKRKRPRDTDDPDEIELWSCRRAVAGKEAGSEHECDDADRDVDEEDRPPAPTEEIDLDERTPEDLTGDRPETDRDAEPGKRAMALGGGNSAVINARTCGTIIAAPMPCTDACDDQLDRRTRQPAGRRRHREQTHAAEKEKPVAVPVA